MIDYLKDRLCDDDLIKAPKILRTHIYVLKPLQYEIVCLLCGGGNIEWSEFESHIWCYDCNLDVFIPQSYSGIFGGPIPFEVSKMLGLNFDRIGVNGNNFLKYKDDELPFEEETNRDRFQKLKYVLDDEILRWEDSWVYDKNLTEYKILINNKLFKDE